MARNQHLYTVYHSLEREGVFDAPSTANPEGGKYFQQHTEYPKYIHAKDHPSAIVNDGNEEIAIRSAWTAEDALKAQTKIIHEKNDTPENRTLLLEKAHKLGLKVDGRTSDKKLAFLVEEAETAAA
jgi:hypothetical protein